MHLSLRPQFGCFIKTALILLILAGQSATAGDWPQILGPDRNGIANDEKLADSWPSSGPKVLWEIPVGEGLAGVAVSGETVVAFYRTDDNRELVVAVDAATGKQRWEQGFKTTYVSGINSDNGPRCVPVISGNRVIVFGAGGGLRCLDFKTGDVLWQVETYSKWKVSEGYFGAGSSPLVVDDIIILNVGASRQDAGIVAFDLKDGSVKWTSSQQAASYSSPIATRIGKTNVAIVTARLATVGIDVASGKELFSIRFGQRGPTVNGANPVVVDDRLFLSASYGIGAVWGKIAEDGFVELWRSDEVCSSQYATAIADNGVLYGVDGRQDFGPVVIKCFDPETRKELWSQGGFEYGTLLKADGKLLFLSCQGELVMIRAAKDGYQELARAQVQKADSGGYRLPALAGGRLFVRDSRSLRALDLSASN